MAEPEPSPDRFPGPMLSSEPSSQEVMACVFGLQDHEVRTYLTLRAKSGATVAELATELDRDRSNVNRSLSTLREKSLVSRHRRLLDGGGHVYQYEARDLESARELMHDTLEEWTASGHARIDEFGEGGRP